MRVNRPVAKPRDSGRTGPRDQSRCICAVPRRSNQNRSCHPQSSPKSRPSWRPATSNTAGRSPFPPFQPPSRRPTGCRSQVARRQSQVARRQGRGACRLPPRATQPIYASPAWVTLGTHVAIPCRHCRKPNNARTLPIFLIGVTILTLDSHEIIENWTFRERVARGRCPGL